MYMYTCRLTDFCNLAERKLRQPAQVPMNRGVVNYPTNQGAAVPGNRAGVGGGNVANRNKNNRKQVGSKVPYEKFWWYPRRFGK